MAAAEPGRGRGGQGGPGGARSRRAAHAHCGAGTPPRAPYIGRREPGRGEAEGGVLR